MDAQRGIDRSGPAAPAAEQPEAEAQLEKRDFPSPTYLASQSLDYTRLTEKADTTPDRHEEPVKPVDEPNLDKPLKPSELASLSLNYTAITTRLESPGSAETIQDVTRGNESPIEPGLNP